MAINRETPLEEFAIQAAERLAWYQLRQGPYHENRALGIKVFDGTIIDQVGRFGDNRINVLEGAVRNRITGTTTPEHTLCLRGLYLTNRSQSVGFEARANLLTGQAAYRSESTMSWTLPAWDRDAAAWRRIMPHIEDLHGFFAASYNGPGRLE